MIESPQVRLCAADSIRHRGQALTWTHVHNTLTRNTERLASTQTLFRRGAIR